MRLFWSRYSGQRMLRPRVPVAPGRLDHLLADVAEVVGIVAVQHGAHARRGKAHAVIEAGVVVGDGGQLVQVLQPHLQRLVGGAEGHRRHAAAVVMGVHEGGQHQPVRVLQQLRAGGFLHQFGLGADAAHHAVPDQNGPVLGHRAGDAVPQAAGHNDKLFHGMLRSFPKTETAKARGGMRRAPDKACFARFIWPACSSDTAKPRCRRPPRWPGR